MPPVTPELEIERQLIEQLTSGESQWTYRPDLKNEGHTAWVQVKYSMNWGFW